MICDWASVNWPANAWATYVKSALLVTAVGTALVAIPPAWGQESEGEARPGELEDDELRTRMLELLEAEGVGIAGLENGRFFIQSADEQHRLNIGGRVQPRFEYQRRENEDNFTRFRFRRLRVDFRGHAFGEDLTFRIMPELRDNARLDTAYVNYRFSEAFQLRAGQYNAPFAWERDVSSSRHQLTERSTGGTWTTSCRPT